MLSIPYLLIKHKTNFLFELPRSCAVRIIPVLFVVVLAEIKYEMCKSCIFIARCRNPEHFSGSSFLTLYALLVHYKPAEAIACLCLFGGGWV